MVGSKSWAQCKLKKKCITMPQEKYPTKKKFKTWELTVKNTVVFLFTNSFIEHR